MIVGRKKRHRYETLREKHRRLAKETDEAKRCADGAAEAVQIAVGQAVMAERDRIIALIREVAATAFGSTELVMPGAIAVTFVHAIKGIGSYPLREKSDNSRKK